MTKLDAAKILGLSGVFGKEEVKDAYYAMLKKFHPDVNPSGLEMTKLLNLAYEALKNIVQETLNTEGKDADYPDKLNAVLNAMRGMEGVEVEICGAWIWVSGNTFPVKDRLKALGFHFAGQKKRWYFRPEEWKSSGRGKMDMDTIRAKYGSQGFEPEKNEKVA